MFSVALFLVIYLFLFPPRFQTFVLGGFIVHFFRSSCVDAVRPTSLPLLSLARQNGGGVLKVFQFDQRVIENGRCSDKLVTLNTQKIVEFPGSEETAQRTCLLWTKGIGQWSAPRPSGRTEPNTTCKLCSLVLVTNHRNRHVRHTRPRMCTFILSFLTAVHQHCGQLKVLPCI